MHVLQLTEDQAVQGQAYPIEVKVYEAGLQIKPSVATITIKDPDGAALVTAAAVTCNGSTGTMTYSMSSALTADLYENCTMQIDYTVSAVAYREVGFFDIVIQPLRCTVIDNDLKAYAPAIVTKIWSTQTAYDTQIQEAFKVVKRDIKNKGKRPTMLIDGSQVRELVILKTFEMIAFDFAKDKDDVWWARFEKYAERYAAALASIVIKYDVDESGTIDAGEGEEVTLGQIYLQR